MTVQEVARRIAERDLAPRARETERNEAVPAAVIRQLGDAGLLAVNVPKQLGGSEAGVVAYSLAMQEIAAGCASTAVSMAVTNMVCEVITKFGTDAQKETYVRALARGDYLGAFALSEADAGSDPGAMRSTARRDGSDWVIDGSKQWITSGSWAGVFVVWARTGDAGTKGISCFLVPGGIAGLRIGRPEEKMGLRGSSTVPLEFEGLRVPDEARLGALGEGFRIAMMALDGGRIGIASQSLGVARAALREAIEFCRAHTPAGTERAIADSVTELDAAHLLTLRAARLKEQDLPFTREASMAKLFASESAWRICDRALRLIGPRSGAEKLWRDVRVTQIYEGTSEIQRLVIARALLRG